MWKLEFTKTAFKGLSQLPKKVRVAANIVLKALTHEGPRPKGMNVRKLSKNEYRLRLTYRYRMKYRVKKNVLIIEIFYIGHRKDAY